MLARAQRVLQLLASKYYVDTQAELAICSVLQQDAQGGLQILKQAEDRIPNPTELQDRDVKGRVRPVRLRKPSVVPRESFQVMEFIRQHASRRVASEDVAIMQGLCTYVETWLEVEALRRFRDTAAESASLDAYFASRSVQATVPGTSCQAVGTAA